MTTCSPSSMDAPALFEAQRARVERYLAILFKELDKASIRYCVLRWNEELWNGAGDIDVLVEPMSISLAVAIADFVARKQNAAAIYDVNDGYHHHLFVSLPDIREGCSQVLTVDFQSAIYEGGRIFATFEDVAPNIEQRGGAPSPIPSMEAALIVIRAVVGKGYFKSNYWEHIRKVCADHPAEVATILATLLTEKVARALMYRIESDNEKGVLELRDKLIAAAKAEGGYSSRRTLFGRILRRVKWLIFPPGILVVINGPNRDAALRLVKILLDSLAGLPFKVTQLCLRQQTSPLVDRRLGSALVAFIQRLATYLLVVRPVLTRNGMVFVTGHMVMNLADQHNQPGSMIRWLESRVGRKPDLIITLTGSDAAQGEQCIKEMSSVSDKPHKNGTADSLTLTNSLDVLSVLEKMSSVMIRKRRRRPTTLLESLGFSRGNLTISAIGLDGAGKGTYIELLLSYFQEKGVRCKCYYLGYASYRLPWLRFIEEKKTGSGRLLYRLLTMAYLAILPIEFLARRGIGTYDVLITDRHPLYEPIFRRGMFKVYDTIIASLCPKPDVVLYFSGDDKVLWARKQEYDYSVYRERSLQLDKLVQERASATPTIRINTVGNISDVFRRVRNAISKYE